MSAYEAKYGPDWETNPKAQFYDPPLGPNEKIVGFLMHGDFEKWRVRRRVPLHELRGKPFGLVGMYDPIQTHHNGANFLPPASYVELIEVQEQIDDIRPDYKYDLSNGDSSVDRHGLEPDGSVKKFPDESEAHVPDDEFVFDRTVALLKFDLKMSIQKQTKGISKKLTGIRRARGLKKPQAPSPDPAWPLYLRVLDARQAGATHSEIGEKLWPKKQIDGACAEASKESFKQAKNWLDPDQYLKLLLMN